MIAKVLLASLLTVSVGANAGVYSDDLGKCIVANTTQSDRLILMQAIYAAMSQHPQISRYSTITDREGEVFANQFANILTQLITKDCPNEAKAAFNYEGAYAFEQAFALMGQVAMQDLTNHPAVKTYFESIGNYIDEKEFEGLGLQ